MTRGLSLLVALLAPAAVAQPVVLGGWTLRDSSTVCGEGTFEYAFEVTEDDGLAPDTVFTQTAKGESAVCWSDFETQDGLLVGVTETMTRWRNVNQILGGDPHPRANPMLGLALRLTRQPDGTWRARLRGAAPTPEQARYLDGPYAFELATDFLPSEPLAPGETWAVPEHVLNAQMGLLDPAGRSAYHIRLDSLVGGRAYLTHTADVTTVQGDRRDRTVRHRRSVVDVATRVEFEAEAERTRTSEEPAIDAHGGSHGTSRTETRLRSVTQRRVQPARR